jgi:hypothetical protein
VTISHSLRRDPCPRPGVSTARYEIHIRGRVGDDLVAFFEGLTSEVLPVETVLHGDIRDQAELHGILDRVQGLGLELIEVRRLPNGVSKPVRAADG